MRLKLVCVQGYKRFADRQCLDTRGRVIAIVGPNEAGKTSLLRAIEHLSSDDEFAVTERTDRGATAHRPSVSAHFSLDADDRKELGKLVPKDLDITYIVSRDSDGDESWEVRPAFPRDTKKRKQTERALTTCIERGWIDELGTAGAALRKRAENLAAGLSTDTLWLDSDVREELTSLASDVEVELRDDTRKAVVQLPDMLRSLASFEEQPTRNELVHERLSRRVPRFLFFGERERELKTDYAWADHATAPPGLANLFAVAEIDYSEMKRAALADDRATLDTLRETADANLRQTFAVWQQGKLHVSFSPNATSLQLLIRDNETASRTRLDERSDGLLAFVALVAFTARYARGVRPILLIDEAETHLHYGAQADLVQVFERQSAAETIIYTTHSIGCLPNDLGASIRAVSPVEGVLYRSTIHNSFWSRKDRVGLTPMMLAMGAEALAFTPSRAAVIGEGASEAILLPSLIRESLPPEEQARPLGYQVAPGISEVIPEDTSDLELEAANVAYLTDSDSAGRDHQRKLPERAKREGRVLPLSQTPGLSLEDFLERTVLAEALNVLLQRSGKTEDRITADELPKSGRATYMRRWCQRRGIDLRKVKADFAQEALDIGRNRGCLAEPSRRRQLRALHKKLLKATGPPARRDEG